MNEHTQDEAPMQQDDPLPCVPASTEALISRVIDRTAAPSDFDELLAHGERAPAALRELVFALRDDCALAGALDRELEVAEQVPAPLGRLRTAAGWRAWSGWAAAALLAVCWAGSAGLSSAAPPGAGAPGSAQQDLLAGLQPSPSEAGLQPRLRLPAGGERGRVVGELPLQLVSTRRAADGPGLDVLVLRRVLERSRVDNVLSLGADDAGRPAPVLVDPALLAAADAF